MQVNQMNCQNTFAGEKQEAQLKGMEALTALNAAIKPYTTSSSLVRKSLLRDTHQIIDKSPVKLGSSPVLLAAWLSLRTYI